MRVNREYKSDDTSTNLAFEIATSEPEPILILASAAVKGRESLKPCPTIATIALPVLPLRLSAEDCSRPVLSDFSEGRTPAMILVAGMPSCYPTTVAVVALSLEIS